MHGGPLHSIKHFVNSKDCHGNYIQESIPLKVILLFFKIKSFLFNLFFFLLEWLVYIICALKNWEFLMIIITENVYNASFITTF